MKLITHNFLTSAHVKGVKTGYPLVIECAKKEVLDLDFSADFVKNMLARLEWPAFRSAAVQLEVGEGLPDAIPEEKDQEDEELLKRIHHALLEVKVVEGNLVCPETGRKFKIQDGIPNMLLR